MTTDLDFDDENLGPKPLRDHAKQVASENAALKQQLAEAAAAQRELALVKAGIDLSTGPGQLFAKAYDGELTPDAVKEAAIQYGVLTAPAPAPTVPAAEQNAWQGMTATAAQASAPGAAEPSLEERIRQADSPEEVMRLVDEANARLG